MFKSRKLEIILLGNADISNAGNGSGVVTFRIQEEEGEKNISYDGSKGLLGCLVKRILILEEKIEKLESERKSPKMTK